MTGPTDIDAGRRRVVIENITPSVDGGRYPIKRTIGETVTVEADIFTDGHDQISAVAKFRPSSSPQWDEAPMQRLENDRWRGEFIVSELGNYQYTVEAWIDHFKSWRHDLSRRLDAGQDVASELLAGARLLDATATRASADQVNTLRTWSENLKSAKGEMVPARAREALDPRLAELMARHPDRHLSTEFMPFLGITVDPVRARFSSWYEMFPRSCSQTPDQHGTLRDCIEQLPRIAGMGFDVLYLPPIHPIGRKFRKGKNNNPTCQPGEPGSPWGIGAREGGHKSVHPELGTLDDLRALVQAARDQGIQVALDIALQCSPDHPYVSQHPEWFRKRPDGSIQYAENPPKKYQDIYPFDFECDQWQALWDELKSIFEYWVEQGIRIFRVDNPHTKPFAFWEWCLNGLKQMHPDLIFLSEAFTRPKVMYRLAKLGFTQSYNYFPWRNTRDELAAYLGELTRPPVSDFFRPSLWPNTPDILPEYLQDGGRSAFASRLILAATLGAAYGIYGPAFELCECLPRESGSEEYLNSEKYEIRHWDLASPDSLQDLIARVNRIRRENKPLQSNHGLRFHSVSNPHLLAYTKSSPATGETILTVVNLDPHHTHSGWLDLPITEMRMDGRQSYQMHDLLTGARFLWKGNRNYLELNPQYSPAHIFRLRQRARTEHDFDYFM